MVGSEGSEGEGGGVWARLPSYKNKAAKKAVVGLFTSRGVRIIQNW